MEHTLVVAADVSKGYADFVLLAGSGQLLVACFRLDDCAAGHRQLTQMLLGWKESYSCKRLLLVVESTGGYEDNWLGLSRRAECTSWVEGYRLNPRITHHEYQVQGRRSIDDGISALTIGLHVCKNLASFEPRRSIEQEDTLAKAALTLCVHIQQLEKNVTQHKNMLDKVLYQYLPFMVSLRGSRWSQYYLSILSRYGSVKSIKRAAKQRFKAIKRVPKPWLERLLVTLQDTSFLRDTPLLIQEVIKEKACEIARLEAKIKQLKKQLIEQADVDKKDVDILCSIGGMGAYSATFLVLHIGQVTRFETASQLAAFYGVPPRMKKSGDGTGYKARMSKQGNRRVRCELYNIAFRTLAHEPYLKSIYAKMRQKGMSHDAALGVLMHKIIRVVYGMLKHQTSFDPGIDQLNQVDPRQQQAVSQPQSENTRLRRYQAEKEEAPVSRRQKRQRKKSHEPQAASAENAGSS